MRRYGQLGQAGLGVEVAVIERHQQKADRVIQRQHMGARAEKQNESDQKQRLKADHPEYPALFVDTVHQYADEQREEEIRQQFGGFHTGHRHGGMRDVIHHQR
ncbi:hypothetical protein D1872_228400 [compost metagenome]